MIRLLETSVNIIEWHILFEDNGYPIFLILFMKIIGYSKIRENKIKYQPIY